MHPVDFTANLHSSIDAQGEVGLEHAECIVQVPKLLNAAIIEHLNEAFVILDRQWRITYCNEITAAFTQKAREELLGKNIWEAFPDSVGSTFYQRCHQAAATGNAEKYEARSLINQEWIRIHIFPSSDDITILLQNITTLKQAQEQEQFQANILRYIRDSVIVTDLQGNITYWNEGARSIFGYTQDEMLGHTIAQLYLDYDLTPEEQTAAKLAEDFEPLVEKEETSLEWQGRRKDGALVWINVKTTTLYSTEGTPCGYLGVAKDITKRKQLDEELRHSKDQLEVILKNVDNGILVQDTTGKIIYTNLQIAMLVGYASVEEMLAAPPSTYWERIELTDEQGQPFLPSQFPGWRAIQGETNSQATFRYVKKQTQEIGWVQIKSTAVYERNKKPSLVISVVQDITQFKELERRKDEFMIHISHELRTPLTALTGFLELINEYSEKIDEPTKARFFTRALENCQELSRMVNTVLDVLQVNHNTQPAQPRHLSLAPLVHEVIEQLDPQSTQKYQFQINIPEWETAWADEQDVRHVLQNLLSNACKYAPQQTMVVVSTSQHQSLEGETPSIPRVCISVQDAGPGIPPAEQPLLFEKFTRLKRDLASTIRGTGLGLYICRQLVDKMGGHIWVESSGQPGEGSRFCFDLPTTAKTAL